MFKFLGIRGKAQSERERFQQTPTTIPGHLFKSPREEDGFLVIGETTSEQLAASDPSYEADKPPEYFQICDSVRWNNPLMGSRPTTLEADDNCSTTNGASAHCSDVELQSRTKNTCTSDVLLGRGTDPPTARDSKSSPPATSLNFTVPQSHGELWRLIPFTLSPKYHPKPVEDCHFRISEANLSRFNYDFRVERSVLRE